MAREGPRDRELVIYVLIYSNKFAANNIFGL